MEQIVATAITLLTLIGAFKAVVVNPLQNSIKELSNAIGLLEKEIRSEIKELRQEIDEVDKQVIIANQAVRSAHYRIDEMKEGD
jgi:F0F1-type ATP synthase membrane subunit b/b'